MRAVRIHEDGGPEVLVLDSRVDDDPFVGTGDDARAVGTEDPRLRHGWKTFTDPEVEVVERGGAQLD